MTTFVFTYDLRKEETSADYKPLIDEIQRLGGHRYQSRRGFCASTTQPRKPTITSRSSWTQTIRYGSANSRPSIGSAMP